MIAGPAALKLTLCIALTYWLLCVSAAAATRHVVLLFDERPELPGMAMLEAEFVRTLTSDSADRIEIYREAMDLSRFGSDTYRTHLRDFLRAKYADKKIDAAVAIISPALDFLLKHGAEIFPGAQIVFCGIDRRELGDRLLPSHIAGVFVKRQFSPSLEIALKIHPLTEHVVVVAGTSEFDRRLLDQAREELGSYEHRLHFSYLTSLPLTKLLDQLSRLPPQSVILFTTLFQDGAGETFVPHDVVERVSSIANAPVYGFLDQYLGRGIVGGSLYSVSAHGAEAAKLVSQVLAGTKPSGSLVVDVQTDLVQFDWRQLQRWGISKVSLPANAEIRFRAPNLWNQYRWYILIGLSALLAEAAIIAGLVVERYRRRAAERLSHLRTLEAIHLNRSATASALSGSVAHELGQPLTAIMNYAAAADVLLSRNPPDVPVLTKIMKEIQKSGGLSIQIISHLRNLLRRTDELEFNEFDFNEVVDAALDILRPEALRRGVPIVVLNHGPVAIRGNQVHLEQVILNLVLNAMDAVSSCPPDQRRVELCTSIRNEADLELSVLDTGPGIAEERLQNVFDTFYTTKKEGTGLGLAISRTIIQNHRGKIWAENGNESGAVFKFTLPLARPPAVGLEQK